MKIIPRLFLASCICVMSAGFVSAQISDAQTHPAGKLAAKPLYRDPVFDHPTDPVFVYEPEAKKWFMYYTQRRGDGIPLIHGTKIGVATSGDGGANWKYIGTADITYGQDRCPTNYTYWAPEVLWAGGKYHMFLAFVPGIFSDWRHPREIAHLTSQDGMKWDTVGKVDLQSEKVIDPAVIQLTNGVWRMFYKDEARPRTICYADSSDLYHWDVKGNAVTNRNGEGPACFRFGGKYWLLADTDRPDGQAIWSSDDCTHWKYQDTTLYGSHGDVVVSGGRAWWFYFGGQRIGNIHWAVIPTAGSSANETNAVAEPAEAGDSGPRPPHGISINVVELKVIDGKLMYTNPSQPTYVDLKPAREKKTDELGAVK